MYQIYGTLNGVLTPLAIADTLNDAIYVVNGSKTDGRLFVIDLTTGEVMWG